MLRRTGYHPNIHTTQLQRETGRKLFTAKEAGYYHPKYSVYFSLSSSKRDDEAFAEDIRSVLRVVE